MPVRKIRPNYSSLTGRLVSWKPGPPIEFESSLERDFAFLLEMDKYVETYTVQPMQIRFKDDGKKITRRYTPDFLVHYHPEFALSKNIKPCIFEVKYREDLKKNWFDLKPKFKAAINYAKENDFIFKIVTEKEIRSDRLHNAKFLYRFLRDGHDHAMETNILKTMMETKESTPRKLIDSMSNDPIERGKYLHILWHMVAHERISTDLNVRLTMNSIIWHL